MSQETNQMLEHKAILDLINSTHRLPRWTLEMLRATKRVLPFLNDGMELLAIDEANKYLEKKFPDYYREEGADEAEAFCLLSIFRELDYHVDKEKIIDAAIAEISDIKRKIRRLKKLQQTVKKAFKTLDPRTKALFAVCDELIRVDGVTTTNYVDTLDIFDSEPVEILRSEPELAPVVEAYDLACQVNDLID